MLFPGIPPPLSLPKIKESAPHAMGAPNDVLRPSRVPEQAQLPLTAATSSCTSCYGNFTSIITSCGNMHNIARSACRNADSATCLAFRYSGIWIITIRLPICLNLLCRNCNVINCRLAVPGKIISHQFCVRRTYIGEVSRLTALLKLCGEHGDRDGNQNGDDGNNDQQFCESKTTIVFLQILFLLVFIMCESSLSSVSENGASNVFHGYRE